MILNHTIYDNGSNNWIVFVHGIGGSTLTWKKQIESFSKDYNLLLIDLPGHGGSVVKKDEKITVKMVNSGIKETLDHLNIKKADFVCMSLGTLVVAHFAIKYPEYVSAIVFGGTIIKVEGIYKGLMNLVIKTKKLLPHRFLYNIFAHVIMPKRNHKKSRKIFIRESLKMKRQTFFSWIDYMYEITKPDKLIAKLKKLGIDMLFVSGEEDAVFIKGAKAVADAVSKTKFKVIKKCGHVCTIEKYQDFNEMSLNFLEKVHKPKNNMMPILA